MKSKNNNAIKSSIFDDDDLNQASEYLRLALQKLSKHKAPATPVNYSLVYSYVSGKDEQIKTELDKALLDGRELSAETAQALYMQLFYNEKAMDEHFRAELLTTVAQVISSLIDISGKSNASSKTLDKHIFALAKQTDANEVLKSVSEILTEAREFVKDTRQLEFELNASILDINRLNLELQNARKEAVIDVLTQLGNRRSFDLEIKKVVENHDNHNVGFSMVLMDIDFFKKINDVHGHLVGDKVLKGLARILKSKVREDDFTARYGGEEFVVLLPEIGLNNAFCVAENIRLSIEKNRLTLRKSGISLGLITASFGVATHRKGETIEKFVERCDNALFRAKNQGRNRTVKAE